MAYKEICLLSVWSNLDAAVHFPRHLCHLLTRCRLLRRFRQTTSQCRHFPLLSFILKDYFFRLTLWEHWVRSSWCHRIIEDIRIPYCLVTQMNCKNHLLTFGCLLLIVIIFAIRIILGWFYNQGISYAYDWLVIRLMWHQN